MNGKNFTTGSIALVLVASLGAAAWFLLLSRPPETCELSGRKIHENMRTVVRIDGRKVHACCPRCPITVARQTGAEVEFLRVTDYVTSRALDPKDAFFVSESRIMVCHTPRVKLDETHTPYMELFDRCGPSLIAFALEREARAFIVENGGSLKRLPDLQRELAAPKPPTEEDAEEE
jgi:hypothetical protein